MLQVGYHTPNKLFQRMSGKTKQAQSRYGDHNCDMILRIPR